MKAIAMLPSPTAAATRFTGLAAHVAAGEDAGHAGLEQVGVAILAPASRLDHRLAGEHVAARVAGNLVRQPGGLGVGADEDEDAAAVLPPRRRRWRGRRSSIAFSWSSPWTACTSERSATWMFAFPRSCSTR